MKKIEEGTSKEKYIEELSKPTFWRLFVDGKKQNIDQKASITIYGNDIQESLYGPLLWSLREPHGLECLRTTAIKLFTEQLNEELTLDFLAQVNSSSFPSIDHLRLIKNNFAIDREEFFGRIVDPKKILQKLNKLNNLSKKKLFALQKSSFGEFYEIIRLPNEEIPNIYKMLFKEYTQSTKTIEVISDFMQDIELLHIFKDANTRMVYLLLNKELMRNNFDPVILDEPNCFDYMNVEELSTEIKKGKIIFKLFSTTGLPYSIKSISQEEIDNNIDKLPFKQVKLSKMLEDSEFSMVTIKEIAQQWIEILDKKEMAIDGLQHTSYNMQQLKFLYNVQCSLMYNRFSSNKKLEKDIKEIQEFVQVEDIESKLEHEGFFKVFDAGDLTRLLAEKRVDSIDKCIEVCKIYAKEVIRVCDVFENFEVNIEDFKNPMLCHIALDKLLYNDNSNETTIIGDNPIHDF